MSLVRTKYGVEYDPGGGDEGSSGLGWVVVAFMIVAAVSFAVTLARRVSVGGDQAPGDDPRPVAADASAASPEARAPSDAVAPPPLAPVDVDGIGRRSPRVRSLMLRLEESARRGDLEMQVSTIEQIRALPPGEAADIAAELLPRLGQLNWTWLFDKKNPQWVGEVVVKRGDTASRIAQENGSTLASFKKLNGLEDPSRIVVGQKVWVMRHPRLNVVVYKRMRAVDVFLNGKLFKRYLVPDAAPEIRFDPGDYKTPASMKDFFRRMGVGLAPGDVDEIDALVPRGTTLNVTAS